MKADVRPLIAQTDCLMQVTVSSRTNTKELDDLVTTDIYTYMETR